MIQSMNMSHVAYQKPFYEINRLYAFAALIVTVLITAYSTKIGPLAVLAFYGMWLPFLLIPLLKQKGFILFPLSHIALPVLFVGWCLYSVFWSDYFSITLYAGTQYLSTILCAIIIARLVPLEDFIRGICYGCVAVLFVLYALKMVGITGIFGSKNVAGFYAQIGVITSLLLFIFSRSAFYKKLALYGLPLLFFVFALISSSSYTSILSTLIICSLLVVALIVSKFPTGLRVISVFCSALIVLSIVLIIQFLQFDIYGFVLELFGKSRTLTGRTEIWQTGLAVSQNAPFLGTGYAAFWVGGQLYAEQIWDQFDIIAKSGFHFHNLFIQTYVETGVIGLLLLIVMILSFFVRGLYFFCRAQFDLPVALFLVCGVLFVTRAFAEVDMFFPYTIGTLLFFAVYTKLMMYKDEKKAEFKAGL